MHFIKNVYFLNFHTDLNEMKFIVVLRDGLYRLPTKQDLHAIAKCCGRRMEFIPPIYENVRRVGNEKFRIIQTKIPAFFEDFIKTESFFETTDGMMRFEIKTISKLPNLNPTKVVDRIQLGEELKAYLRCVTL